MPEVNALHAYVEGQGVGTALMVAAEGLARQWGYDVIGLAVEPGNARARRLYERLGYAEKGEVIDEWTEQADDGTILESHADPAGWPPTPSRCSAFQPASSCVRGGSMMPMRWSRRAATRRTDIDLKGGSAEIVYWVLPALRGAGVVVEATKRVTRWALDDLGLHRLRLCHSVANPASCRVAAKTGYVLEGTMRSALLHADGWHDQHLHALISV
ncbi:GNAT family N-acetyltransferase [Kribbella sp. NBC_01245]|uniref:GNAT family N-acetyltransferase n=1 Tax=Kribbella sp. NBC_01245 TaxID=2903578 RepID=UPI002E2E6271|nr:GNAT family N-acetyltransferase [Kribbella sp. NBC_01245]